jgi:transposase
MFVRRCFKNHLGKRHAYWALVESVRTERGPRQRVVAYLGDLDQAGRLGMVDAAVGACGKQRDVSPPLFEDGTPAPRFVEVDTSRVGVENVRSFGGAWLALQLIDRLALTSFLDEAMPRGREEIAWSVMSLVLVIGRLLDPSSELRLAEHLYQRTALPDLLGVAAEKVNDDRLYRALDALLPHKDALQKHLKNRLGELFDLKYDLLLYDVTSTYFEGQCGANPLAQRGYSRDQRSDCKQVCIALVVSREGMPIGYELFAGNKADVSSVEQIVTTMEDRYGRSDRIWVMDRGMSSADNIEFLKEGNRRYIIGTPKSMLKKYEHHLLQNDWCKVRDGLEVRLCVDPEADPTQPPGQASPPPETFILCRSADRAKKEQAMHQRFEKRIEEGLARIVNACGRQKLDAVKVSHRVGKLLGQNTRAAGAFKTTITTDDKGRAMLQWEKVESWRDWASLSEGCYLLRSNVSDWTAEELWQAYMQLTQAEAAFRIHKSDLSLRPVWHQKQERVEAHILVCFLAYVLWKTLAQWCKQAGLGDEPRKVLDEIAQLNAVDIVLPTRCGRVIRKSCIATPTQHQSILLEQLKLRLPRNLTTMENVVKKII